LRKSFKALLRHLLREHNEPGRLGAAVATGLFVGALPLYGLHLPICIGLAWIFRLNKATVYLAANISNPLMAPFLIAAALAIGEWMRFGAWRGIDVGMGRDFIENIGLLTGQVPDMFLSCVLGGAVLGLGLAAIGGPVTWLWAKRRKARSTQSEPPAS
jgi:uncharacterized protein (DUF2062 family)